MEKVKQVLLIDDDEGDNEYHSMVINETGVNVKLHSFVHPWEALECWKKGCETNNENTIPDLVFLDINMPRLTGFQLLDEIRKVPDPHERIKKMKIFILSTSVNPPPNVSFENYEDLISGYYVKPLTGEMFEEIMEKHFPPPSEAGTS